MSIQAVSWVLDHSQSRGLARLVLIALANHANGETGECWPSYRKLATEAGISIGAVSTQIGRLVTLGEIEVLDQGSARRPAHYRLPFLTSVQQMNAGRKGERSADERSVHAGMDAAFTPAVDRTVINRNEEEAPPDELPSMRWARRWAEMRNMTFTRSVKKSWVPKVSEFIAAGGVPSEGLLVAAVRAGIESPGGWGFVKPEVVAELNRAMEHRDCGACRGRGFVEVYAPGAGMTKIACGGDA